MHTLWLSKAFLGFCSSVFSAFPKFALRSKLVYWTHVLTVFTLHICCHLEFLVASCDHRRQIVVLQAVLRALRSDCDVCCSTIIIILLLFLLLLFMSAFLKVYIPYHFCFSITGEGWGEEGGEGVGGTWTYGCISFLCLEMFLLFFFCVFVYRSRFYPFFIVK